MDMYNIIKEYSELIKNSELPEYMKLSSKKKIIKIFESIKSYQKFNNQLNTTTTKLKKSPDNKYLKDKQFQLQHACVLANERSLCFTRNLNNEEVEMFLNEIGLIIVQMEEDKIKTTNKTEVADKIAKKHELVTLCVAMGCATHRDKNIDFENLRKRSYTIAYNEEMILNL